MKKEKKQLPRATQIDRAAVREWQPLFRRLTETIDWALDIASQLSSNYHEEHVAIEKVRAFVHGWLGGERVEVPALDDLLTTIGILFAKIEIDLGIDSSALFVPLRSLRDWLRRAPAYCPGACRDEPTVVTGRPPKFRNTRATHLQVAA